MKNKYESWSDDDLKNEFQIIADVLNARKKNVAVKKAKELCINGITAKDVAVRYGSYDGGEIENINDVNFSFFVKHDGKEHCIYYDSGTYDKDHNFTIHPWWPIIGEDDDDQYERNGAFSFIPPGFSEACENSYEFTGTFDEAVERLKEHGITDIEKGNW